MVTSQFQFSNPILVELQFSLNNEYSVESEDISVDLDIQIGKKRISETEALVELTIIIGADNKEAPFYIKAVEGAQFRWEKGAFDGEDSIDRLLSVNAPALLLSYLRPIISNVTGVSKYPAYNIPFINFNCNNEDEND